MKHPILVFLLVVLVIPTIAHAFDQQSSREQQYTHGIHSKGRHTQQGEETLSKRRRYLMNKDEKNIVPVPLMTFNPTNAPSRNKDDALAANPSFQPRTNVPTPEPTSKPTSEPTFMPTETPTGSPTNVPTDVPTITPSMAPTSTPSMMPTSTPSMIPTSAPSDVPSDSPSNVPSTIPSMYPTIQPSSQPTGQPSKMPSLHPSAQPSMVPSKVPSTAPTNVPTVPLTDFSILVTKQNDSDNVNQINVGVVGSVLEEYLQTTMRTSYPNLEYVQLSLLEGTNGYNSYGKASSTLRLSGVVTFVGYGMEPSQLDLSTVQGAVLTEPSAQKDVQEVMTNNTELRGIVVEEISFQRLNACQPFPNDCNGTITKDENLTLILVAILGGVSILIMGGATYVLRHQMRRKTRAATAAMKTSELAQHQMDVTSCLTGDDDIPCGCASLIGSQDVSDVLVDVVNKSNSKYNKAQSNDSSIPIFPTNWMDEPTMQLDDEDEDILRAIDYLSTGSN